MGFVNFTPLVGCSSKGKTPGFGPGNGGSIPSHPVAEVPCVPDNSLKGDHVQHAAGNSTGVRHLCFSLEQWEEHV